MQNVPRSAGKIVLSSLFLFLSIIAFSAHASAPDGEDNPTGVAGIYNGNVEDGDSWDPNTANQMHVVHDIDVVTKPYCRAFMQALPKCPVEIV